MTLAELSYYLLSQFEEFGRLLIKPATIFFEKYPNPNQTVMLTLLIGFAVLGIVNTFGVSRYLIENLFAKQLKNVATWMKIWLSVVLAVLLAFMLSGVALILAEKITSQQLLFVLAIAVMFPPAGLFFGAFTFATIAIAPPVFWLGVLLSRVLPKYTKPILKVAVVTFFLCSLAALVAMITELSWERGGMDAHHVHAIVKNTCLIDPKKENCPQNAEDIGKVEPEFFQKFLDRNQVFYSYNASQNQYVLLVRYSRREAILFSQLLKSPEQNGSQANDFKVVSIETFGKDRVNELPEFAKQFEYLPEWNKR